MRDFTFRTVLRSCYHKCRSFVPGTHIAHFWIEGALGDLTDKWEIFFANSNLVSGLQIGEQRGKIIHLFCKISLFLDLDLVARFIENNTLTQGDKTAVQLATINQDIYDSVFGIHYSFCKKNNIPASCGLLGSFPYTSIGLGKYTRVFVMNLRQSSNSLSTLIGTNKSACRSYVESFGLPVAKGETVWSYEQARWAASKIGFPVVVKSAVSSNSEKVFVGIRNLEQLDHSLRTLGGSNDQFIIEEQIHGEEYRAYFSNGKFHSVWKGTPKTIAGDGKSSIKTLIDQKYPGFFEQLKSNMWTRKKFLQRVVGYDIFTLSDASEVILDTGETISITPAISTNSLYRVDNSVIKCEDAHMLETLLTSLGRPSCGIDLILTKPNNPLSDSGKILEINIPSGFGYLDKPESVIEAEICEELDQISGFWDCHGDVDIGIIHTKEVYDSEGEQTPFFSSLAEQIQNDSGQVLFPSGIFDWSSILNIASANAFLLVVDDDLVINNGLPSSKRLVWHSAFSTIERQNKLPWLFAFFSN